MGTTGAIPGMKRARYGLKEIESSPEGPQIAALFDFDGTIIAGFSVLSFLREKLTSGEASITDLVEQFASVLSFSLGRTGFSGLMGATAQMMRGTEEQTFVDFGVKVYEKHIAATIYPEARALILAHLRKGHTLGIISSATKYQVLPAAKDLHVENVLCTELEVFEGKFTGEVVAPTCWGQGKVLAAEKLAQQYGCNLAESFFYTDSHDDVLLLEAVGHPRPLNPNSRLTKIAKKNAWPIKSFNSRGRPGFENIVRTAMTYSTLFPAVLSGLPIWAMTGSRTEAVNFSFSVWADYASALGGMKVRVEDEGNLWAARPAIFVFNHQSAADAIILAKLIRRDLASVGKKEIANIPIIGQLFQYGGVVLIDRVNREKAIEAMAPLIDVIKKEGKSVAIAPEGTRSVTPKLGKFKKGAFHLAIQAGVPMVPIVIHNALDFMPKGDLFVRPATVDVTVLKPVDTSKWSAETIDAHVEEVRNLFLHSLGQHVASTEPFSQSIGESLGESIGGDSGGEL